MRVQIQPKTGLLDAAHYFSCDNARVVNRNIVCSIAFWAASGRKLDEQDATLTEEQYAAWCDTDADSDDIKSFTEAHCERLGLVIVPPPPPMPYVPPVPPTPEEIEAARQAQISDLQARIAQLQDEPAAMG